MHPATEKYNIQSRDFLLYHFRTTRKYAHFTIAHWDITPAQNAYTEVNPDLDTSNTKTNILTK